MSFDLWWSDCPIGAGILLEWSSQLLDSLDLSIRILPSTYVTSTGPTPMFISSTFDTSLTPMFKSGMPAIVSHKLELSQPLEGFPSLVGSLVGSDSISLKSLKRKSCMVKGEEGSLPNNAVSETSSLLSQGESNDILNSEVSSLGNNPTRKRSRKSKRAHKLSPVKHPVPGALDTGNLAGMGDIAVARDDLVPDNWEDIPLAPSDCSVNDATQLLTLHPSKSGLSSPIKSPAEVFTQCMTNLASPSQFPDDDRFHSLIYDGSIPLSSTPAPDDFRVTQLREIAEDAGIPFIDLMDCAVTSLKRPLSDSESQLPIKAPKRTPSLQVDELGLKSLRVNLFRCDEPVPSAALPSMKPASMIVSDKCIKPR